VVVETLLLVLQIDASVPQPVVQSRRRPLVGAFSMIVQPVVEPMDRFAALVETLFNFPHSYQF